MVPHPEAAHGHPWHHYPSESEVLNQSLDHLYSALDSSSGNHKDDQDGDGMMAHMSATSNHVVGRIERKKTSDSSSNSVARKEDEVVGFCPSTTDPIGPNLADMDVHSRIALIAESSVAVIEDNHADQSLSKQPIPNHQKTSRDIGVNTEITCISTPFYVMPSSHWYPTSHHPNE
jgi:hypothetical protein